LFRETSRNRQLGGIQLPPKTGAAPSLPACTVKQAGPRFSWSARRCFRIERETADPGHASIGDRRGVRRWRGCWGGIRELALASSDRLQKTYNPAHGAKVRPVDLARRRGRNLLREQNEAESVNSAEEKQRQLGI